MTRTAPELAPPSPSFHAFIVPNKSRPPHAGGAALSPLPALHPFWVVRASVGIFNATPAGGHLATTYDLNCNGPTYNADLQWNRASNLDHFVPLAQSGPHVIGIYNASLPNGWVKFDETWYTVSSIADLKYCRAKYAQTTSLREGWGRVSKLDAENRLINLLSDFYETWYKSSSLADLKYCMVNMS
ncbi:hypothetical protein AVEN_153634-1 [Araneus ventricosus]|uniref:Uncharacterized protein n=1 Tax=Araneus ventricosus TaxID=182803 RepID=A0A4Y2BRQ6_ARAVE|nr:hypothetical protein AVEN_153634-1 [Araneus ventricosus]